MKTSFILALIIVIVGVFNYEKMSYKAMYYRNKKNGTGYYWGGVPRNSKRSNNNDKM